MRTLEEQSKARPEKRSSVPEDEKPIEAATTSGGLPTISREAFTGKHDGARFATIAVLLLILYATIRSLLHAEHKPFWYDELCTWIVTRQPGISGIWNALIRAADSPAPGFYLIEKICSALVHDQNIAFRIPSILGFCGSVWFLFVWLKKRFGPLVAIAGAQVPFISALFLTYATEARPYALACACVAAALVCYQRGPSLRWMTLMGLSLASAECLHYYSIFATAPFMAAEALYTWKRKTVRWRVWAAVGSAILPLAAFWPLLVSLKTYYGQSFWSKPSLLQAWATYGWLLGIPAKTHAITSSSTLLNLFVAAGAIAFASLLLIRSLQPEARVRPAFEDGLLISMFLALPLVIYAATKLTHGGLTARYMLPVILGVVMATGYLLSRLRRRMVIFAGLALFSCLAVQEAAFWIGYYGSYQLGFAPPQSPERLIASVDHENLCVVISNPHQFLELAHYAGPHLKSRLVSVVDPTAARLYTGSDSSEKELLVLRKFAPLSVFEYPAFKKSHPTFLFYSDAAAENGSDWWLSRLALDSHSLRRLARDREGSVYLVSLNP